MTTWNRSGFIHKAIESVREQTFKNWELIIADDGSTDDTKGVIEAWMRKEPRIVYVNPGHTGRIAKISNAGLRKAQGEYIAILDDDDYWISKEKLEHQVNFLDAHKGYVGCGGGYAIIDEHDVERTRILKPEHDDEIRKVALLANPMVNSTTIFRHSVAEKFGFYDETMKQFADWDFWLQMGLQGKLYNFPEYFLAYRMWPGGMSFAKQKENAGCAVRIVNRYKNNYPNYPTAILMAYTYLAYAQVPMSIKRGLNPILSRLKKTIFSG